MSLVATKETILTFQSNAAAGEPGHCPLRLVVQRINDVPEDLLLIRSSERMLSISRLHLRSFIKLLEAAANELGV